MSSTYTAIMQQVYSAFNARAIDEVLSFMHPKVHWPNAWEGGYVEGHAQVGAYWTRQWQVLNPMVFPIAVQQRPDGKVMVTVHQLVKDLTEQVVFDGSVTHVYTFDQGLITNMTIES